MINPKCINVKVNLKIIILFKETCGKKTSKNIFGIVAYVKQIKLD